MEGFIAFETVHGPALVHESNLDAIREGGAGGADVCLSSSTALILPKGDGVFEAAVEAIGDDVDLVQAVQVNGARVAFNPHCVAGIAPFPGSEEGQSMTAIFMLGTAAFYVSEDVATVTGWLEPFVG